MEVQESKFYKNRISFKDSVKYKQMKKTVIFIAFYGFIITCSAQSINYYDLKPFRAWHLSSVPFKQPDLFPESYLQNDNASGFNRAKICWYSIDPLFLQNNSLTPQHIIDDPLQQKNHFTREIISGEVYPSSQNPDEPVATLDLGFYPNEKGAFNFDVSPSIYSFGIDSTNHLNVPSSRWGGIMRPIEKGIFTSQILNYLGFWLMDPFIYDPSQNGGYLYFNIGNVSEDVLKDGKMSYENGLPITSILTHVDTTAWGIVSDTLINNNTFSTILGSRQYQDVGLDGLGDANERTFFQNYLNSIANLYGMNSIAYLKSYLDPSTDNYHYFRGTDLDQNQTSIIKRYRNYNNYDGNSSTADMSPESYLTNYSDIPDNEDINHNSILDTVENYFQYRIVLDPDSFVVGHNFITDKIIVIPANGDGSPVTWYKFLVPLNTNKREIFGNINCLDSSGFVRLFLKGFSDSLILRFLELAFVTTDLTSINEMPDNSAIKIYPNPSNGLINIDNETKSVIFIKVYDLIGRELLYSKQLENTYNPKIDVSFLNNGMYILVIKYASHIFTKKLLIEK